MQDKQKKITVQFSVDELDQIKESASEKKMSVAEYVHYMATIFCYKDIQLDSLKEHHKNDELEKELIKISDELENKKRHIEMIQKSVNSASWKIESHMRKIKAETAQELQKDLDRINYLASSKSKHNKS